MVQEYGRYYGLRTCTLRGGCLTGRAHSGVKLHGFLSYLVQCALDRSEYTIIGYEGKQVRDQIHSQDVVGAIWHIANHLDPGTVYNLGGGRDNSASILEVIQMIESRLGSEIRTCYEEQPRIGDHKCYYTDVSKLRARYPQWSVTRSLENILDELISDSWHDLRKASHRVP
jgi:CDP-paratose 2-epimerase